MWHFKELDLIVQVILQIVEVTFLSTTYWGTMLVKAGPL